MGNRSLLARLAPIVIRLVRIYLLKRQARTEQKRRFTDKP